MRRVSVDLALPIQQASPLACAWYDSAEGSGGPAIGEPFMDRDGKQSGHNREGAGWGRKVTRAAKDPMGAVLSQCRKLHGRLVLSFVARRSRRIEPGGDEWQVLQEKVSRLGGKLGIAARAVFYAHSLRRCGADPFLLPGVSMLSPQLIELGDEVHMNRGVVITAQAEVSIGNRVLMGPYVHVNSGNHRFDDRDVPILKQGKDCMPIVIEDDVWVAANVVITAGSRIGRGSIVMAGAVVSGDVEPYSIVGGVPARLIRRRGDRTRSREEAVRDSHATEQ